MHEWTIETYLDARSGYFFEMNPSGLMADSWFGVNNDNRAWDGIWNAREVDQRQVNLTPFSLFFPERRDFFLDGATFFDFGSTSGSNDLLVKPFFSRRIGLSGNATPQRIDFGTRVTGQLGSHDLGLLHVRSGDDDDAGLAGEEFTAARVKTRVLQQSYVGALYTRRDARHDAESASHTAGVDFRLATSRFAGSQNLSATGWFLHANRPGVTSRNNAFGVFLEYPNDLWTARLGAREVQRDFDPSVGFVTRRGYRRYQPTLAFAPRPRGHRFIRRLEFAANVDVLTDVRNRLLERSVGFTLLDVQLHSQDGLGFELTPTHERLDAAFRVANGITLPMDGEYDYSRVAVRGQTASRHVIALNGRHERGGFYFSIQDRGSRQCSR